MDGVVTRTARLHAAAWKALFDDFLRSRDGESFRPFDERAEYRAYVDGKPRLEGVRSFLRARDIQTSPEKEEELAARKDALFEKRLREQGVETFASTIALMRALREGGTKVGVVTSSRHGREVLKAAGLTDAIDDCLDGVDLEALTLKGKPDPDMFLAAAERLGAPPARTLVFEDAVSGVQAGRRGGFGLVVGVDRGGNAKALERAGADLVVPDLGELDAPKLESAFAEHREAIAWRVEEEGFDPARERQMETLFSVGNGYLGVRGALDMPPPGSQCDFFIAGVYDRKRPDLPYSEIEFLAPERGGYPYAELVPLPYPFRLQLAVEGRPLDFSGEEARSLRRVLELRQGVLRIEALFESSGGRRTALRSRRCASAADPHLLLQEAVAEPENHYAPVALAAELDETELAPRHPHLERLEHVQDGELELVRYATRASGCEICIASRTRREGERLQRRISVFTSRDGPQPRAAALAHLEANAARDFDALLAAHEEAWASFWQRADIRIPGRAAVQQALRFGAYHLRLPAADDPRVSIGARSLTGRAYEGHVFWDTEIFMLPFHLYTSPQEARNLLLYRFNTLEGARRRARELGYRGACYAWESTVTGDDVTPTNIVLKSSGKEIPIFTGREQIHVTADVAYAVWRYWEATRDEDFLAGPGAEILFDTARFWASRISSGHIRGVVGPDEYHHSVNDNAYTNWMARFNLQIASRITDLLGKCRSEGSEWAEVAAQLYCPAPNADGVIEQFAGFFELEDYPLGSEERFKAPVDRLFDWERVNRMKLVKQADVLMLPFLFPEAFSDEVVAANYRYYEPITDHASSLSPSVHAAIAARLGLREDAERYWRQSLYLDLSNAMDNSTLGVHVAAMGGNWQALVFGFLGVRFDDEGPRADPRAGERLPASWPGVELSLFWRGRSHTLKVQRS